MESQVNSQNLMCIGYTSVTPAWTLCLMNASGKCIYYSLRERISIFVEISFGSKCRIAVPWFYLTTIFLEDDISTTFITLVVLIVYFTTLLVYRTVASMLRLLSGDMETVVQEKQSWADRGIFQTFAWIDWEFSRGPLVLISCVLDVKLHTSWSRALALR